MTAIDLAKTQEQHDSERSRLFGLLPRDAPLALLNLVRLREWAEYSPASPEFLLTPVPGREAFNRYSAEAEPLLAAANGRVVWIGEPAMTLVGEAEDQWSLTYVTCYESAGAAIALIRSESYRLALRHREAAVASSRVFICRNLSVGPSFSPLEYFHSAHSAY